MTHWMRTLSAGEGCECERLMKSRGDTASGPLQSYVWFRVQCAYASGGAVQVYI